MQLFAIYGRMYYTINMTEVAKQAETKQDIPKQNGVELLHLQEARKLLTASSQLNTIKERQQNNIYTSWEKKVASDELAKSAFGFDMWAGTLPDNTQKPKENFVESSAVKDKREMDTATGEYQDQLKKTYDTHMRDLQWKPEEQKKLWAQYLEGCIHDLKINPEAIGDEDVQLIAKSLPDVWKNILLNPDSVGEKNPTLKKIQNTLIDRIADGAASIDRADFLNNQDYEDALLKNFKDISGVSVDKLEDLQALLGTLKKQKEDGKITPETEKMIWALQNTVWEKGGGNAGGFHDIGGPVASIWVCSENFPQTPDALQSALSSIRGEEGISESKDPQRIREYHAAVGLNAGPSTPWCMSFVQYMSRKYLGYNGPKTASARDGLKMWNTISTAEAGAIVVTRGSGPSGCHIGLSVGNGEYISWNSGNAVKIKKIPSGAQFRSLQKNSV